MDHFIAIAHERAAVADLLDSSSDEQWLTPSCCGDWAVEDVAAHLTVVWNYSAFEYLKPDHATTAVATATSRRFALFSNRRDLADLCFRAVDLDWNSGSGPEVAGPARSLVHAMWGRESSPDARTGPGVDVLRRRLESPVR